MHLPHHPPAQFCFDAITLVGQFEASIRHQVLEWQPHLPRVPYLPARFHPLRDCAGEFFGGVLAQGWLGRGDAEAGPGGGFEDQAGDYGGIETRHGGEFMFLVCSWLDGLVGVVGFRGRAGQSRELIQ